MSGIDGFFAKAFRKRNWIFLINWVIFHIQLDSIFSRSGGLIAMTESPTLQPGSILGEISSQEMQIWEKGFNVGKSGISREKNPYKKNTREWELWDDGWYNGYK